MGVLVQELIILVQELYHITRGSVVAKLNFCPEKGQKAQKKNTHKSKKTPKNGAALSEELGSEPSARPPP